ncbi:MAG: TIGR00297 family protein [Oculatellaceae cyanobacterium Prado106]|jgi:uncharacterized protein (TIGR00297 family)|nr:TIGR00297 family protein [Oculatellaceae cyanobacterium Prado106]
MLSNPWFIAIALNTMLLAIAAIAPKKLLTPSGIAHAWVLGVTLWGTLGWPGYTVMMFYFLVGSAVTRIGLAEKEALGIAEARSGARGPGNVWGSALVGFICAIAITLIRLNAPTSPLIPLLLIGYVASISTKLSDTCGTEVGKAYGKRTYLITTLQSVPRGTEGAVSLEGTLAGVVGSVAIATVAWSVGLISPPGIGICAIAAFIATTIESLIGATIEGKLPLLTHDVVNILNTLIGAAIAILLTWLSSTAFALSS